MESCKSLELEGMDNSCCKLAGNKSNTGVTVQVGSDEKLCKAKVLCATFDLPAKAKVLEFTNFNGRCGCTVCKEEGMVVKVGRGTTRIYKSSQALGPLRSHDECFTLGQRALLQEQVCIVHK